MHAEAPVRGGRAFSQQDADTIFGYLKDLHANFVRLAHYPHDERMERTADRDGIMIWSEIPNWQRISFDKPEVYAKDVAMLKEMIRRDRNKASVILWSVSNETGNNPTRTKFLSDLVAEARKLDPTRLITSALNRAASQRQRDGAGRSSVRCARRDRTERIRRLVRQGPRKRRTTFTGPSRRSPCS
jgi:beta-glucuronidase